MLALAPRTAPSGILAPPQRDLVEQVILALEPEAATPSGPALDAAALAALGWQVRAETRVREPAWRCRSPWATGWIPLPRVSASVTTCGQLMVPPRWDWGCGARAGLPYGFVRRDDAVWFEATGTTPARCLLKAALHAHRWLLIEAETSDG